MGVQYTTLQVHLKNNYIMYLLNLQQNYATKIKIMIYLHENMW
jgi:hypothetical protein